MGTQPRTRVAEPGPGSPPLHDFLCWAFIEKGGPEGKKFAKLVCDLAEETEAPGEGRDRSKFTRPAPSWRLLKLDLAQGVSLEGVAGSRFPGSPTLNPPAPQTPGACLGPCQPVGGAWASACAHSRPRQ